jgi:tRNA (adenine57-N1/adenine58-N1)-methyltransferase
VTEPLAAGDLCLFIDGRGRRYLVDLEDGASFQYHAGVVAHREIIGRLPGTAFRTGSGARLVALRPRLSDYVLLMKRGAQVVYPKDLGPMIHWGDVGPGMTVLDAGTGSGALAMALLRAVGPQGRVVTVERRPEHAQQARRAISRFYGSIPDNLDLRVGDVTDVIETVRPDRLMLDLPEPWPVVDPAGRGLADDGVMTVFLPTVPQVQRLHDELRRSQRFTGATTFEVLHREWVADRRSVRPVTQMVGHTGFITVAHRTQGPPEGDTDPQ